MSDNTPTPTPKWSPSEGLNTAHSYVRMLERDAQTCGQPSWSDSFKWRATEVIREIIDTSIGFGRQIQSAKDNDARMLAAAQGLTATDELLNGGPARGEPQTIAQTLEEWPTVEPYAATASLKVEGEPVSDAVQAVVNANARRTKKKKAKARATP